MIRKKIDNIKKKLNEFLSNKLDELKSMLEAGLDTTTKDKLKEIDSCNKFKNKTLNELKKATLILFIVENFDYRFNYQADDEFIIINASKKLDSIFELFIDEYLYESEMVSLVKTETWRFDLFKEVLSLMGFELLQEIKEKDCFNQINEIEFDITNKQVNFLYQDDIKN